MKIGILGGGHLATTIIDGLLNSEKYQKKDLKIVVASDKSITRFTSEQFQVSKDWNFLVNCQVIILALRPNDINELKNQLSTAFSKNQIIISVAGGVSLLKLQQILSNYLITRVMPNTACQVNQSMTMIVKEGNQIANEKAQMIFNLLGKTVILPEAKIHVFIAICGSAIAYPYYWLEPLMTLSLQNNISLEDSKIIIANMLIGAATNILYSEGSLQELQNQVTVAGGTTIEAIKVFNKIKLKKILKKQLKQ